MSAIPTSTAAVTALATNATSSRTAGTLNKSPYGYVPTEWICILFVVLFGVSTLIHVVQTFRSRLWWLIPTAYLAGVGEIIGWSARLWSSKNVLLLNPYIIQMTTTMVAPTPLIAANFITLGQIIRRMGQDYSRLTVKWYTMVFCACDVIALVIQAVGGAMASVAIKKASNPDLGGNIMLAGVSFQMASLVVYAILASESILRYIYDHPFAQAAKTVIRDGQMDKKIKLMIIGLLLEAIILVIRSIYRIVELTDGWRGTIITAQAYFDVFDGATIVLAMYTLNFLHPGTLLGDASEWDAQADQDEYV